MDNKNRREVGQNSFTEDLITEIISRVPAKHLLRFTCVSKSWCSLIRTDSYFCGLQRTALLDRPCLFIHDMIRVPYVGWVDYHYWIDLESLEDQSVSSVEIQNPFPIGNGFGVSIVAYCRGLLVLQQILPSRSKNKIAKIAVSNPITRKHVMVPPNPAGDDQVCVFGFGYDHVHHCHKLLTRVQHIDKSLELMVYDLDKGTWKRLQFGMWWKALLEYGYEEYSLEGCDLNYNWDCEDSDDDIQYNIPDWDVIYFGKDLYDRWDTCHPKCVDGVVYWCFDVERPTKMTMMVCFLLAEEQFHVVKPPDRGEVTNYYPKSLTVFERKLGLVCQALNTRHEFWTMDMDYDDDDKRQWRWTKLLVISDVSPYRDPRYYYVPFPPIPVCFSACKNKILILVQVQKYQLFWYDILKKKFYKFKKPINGRCKGKNDYVSVDGLRFIGIEIYSKKFGSIFSIQEPVLDVWLISSGINLFGLCNVMLF